jgi:Protein of unknown function (DUF1579)
MVRSFARTAAAVLAAAWLSSTAVAQDRKDPQSSFEPRSAPGAGQKLLEEFVGDWDVVKTFHPKTGEPFRAAGMCKQTMIHGGRFLQSQFTFQSKAGPSTGTGIIGFDAGRFTSVWVDSRATRMSFRQGKDPFDGNEIVLYSQSLGGTNERPSRTVTRLEDDGRRIVHRQYALAADGPGRLVMELVMTRKAAPGR